MGIFKGKKKLWIIIACVLVVVIAATATGLVILLNRDTEDTSADDNNKIYWNIDRQIYYGQGEGGASSREIDKTDGYYHILLAADGRPIERKAKSLTVVNKVDGEDAMGVVIDEQTREITDIIPLEEISGGFLCSRYYVDEVNGTELKLNSSATYMGMDLTVKLQTTTPIYDVSLQAQSDAGMPVKLESIEHKDQVSIILNKDESIYAVYITKRAKITPIYWNIERKYDKKQSETTREPDKDGVYHILMAVGGEQVEVKCKDKQAVSLIDSRGNRCCGLEFDEEGYVVDSVSALKCTGGKSVASWYDVMSLDGDMFTAEKHSETARDNGKQFTLTLDPDCEIYNVSTNYEDHIGEKTTLHLTDRVQGFTDATGKVVVLFIVQRWKTGDLYFNPYRMWDSTNLKSTRTRSDDGFFHFILLLDGHEVNVKVKDASVAELMDKAGSRSMGLKFTNGIVTEYIPAGEMYGSKASWYDVERFVDEHTIHVKKNSTTASDAGREYDVKLKDDCKIYNTTQFYTDHLGEETTLRVGDRIQAWVDYTGKAKIIYIVGRKVTNPYAPHSSNHNCKDCNKNVTWTAWTSGSSLPTTSGHYYLTGDVVSAQANIQANQNVVLCLNGHNIRAAGKRIFALTTEGSKLSIHDCVGTGQVYSKYSGDLGTTQGAIIWARSGDVKLFGGTYIAPTGVSHNTGCVIHANSNRNIYIENCTIKGGTTEKSGGAIYMGAGSKTVLTLKNTTVTAGKSGTGHGDAILMSSNSKLYLSGKIVISGGKDNLYLASGALVYFNNGETLAKGSSIGVNVAATNGQVTKTYNSGIEKYFVSNNAERSVEHTSSYVYLDKKNPYTNHKNTSHICEECGNSVKWIPWRSSITLPTDSGHYYLTGNVVTTQVNINQPDSDIVICLNGYNIQGTANRVIALNADRAKLTITDCTKKGKVYNGKTSAYAPSSTGTPNTTQGGTIWVRKGSLNIYNCTVSGPASAVPGNGATICSDANSNAIVIKNATIIGGTTNRNGGALFIDKGSLSLNNVTVTGGKAKGNGNSICMGSSSTLRLAGTVKIGDKVYLGNNAYVNFTSALSSSSSVIKINTATKDGKISTNNYPGMEKLFTSDAGKINIVNHVLYIGKGAAVTNHNNANHECEECEKNVTWTPWTDTTALPKQEGHYYLCYDVTISQQTISETNNNIVICLNGHTVKGGSNRLIAINASGTKLTITDCTKKGSIINTKSSEYTSSDPKSPNTTQGAVIWNRNATLNIFNCTLQAPTSVVPNNGAVICSDGSNTVKLVNVTIKGGTTAKNGGAIYQNAGTLKLDNVTITGGKAKGHGDSIYMGNAATLSLANTIKINNKVYLGNTAYVNFESALSSGSSKININTASKDGKISKNYYTGMENFFTSDAGKINIVNHVLYIGKGAAVTNHNNANHQCEECEKDVTWTPWTDLTALPTKTGHYYLCYDVNCPQQTISDSENVVICLNGHTVSGTSGANRVIAVNGKATLTITDCTNTGIVKNTKTSGSFGSTQGSVIWVREGTLKIFSGTYEATPAEIPGHGGAICSDVKANEIIIKNATIKGGKTAKNGGAISIDKGTLSLENVTVTGGNAQGNGDAVYIGTDGTFKVANMVRIDNNIYLDNSAYIKLESNLNVNSRLKVQTGTESGKITTNYLSGAEKYITSADGLNVVKLSGALYIDNGLKVKPHNDNIVHICEDCEQEVYWEPWIETNTLPTKTGHYYLCNDITCSQQSITTAEDVVICLNGHTVSGTASANRVIRVDNANARLTITDCTKEGKIINGKTSAYAPSSDGKENTTQGSVIWVRTGTLNIFGGTYEATSAELPGNGGAICSDINANEITIKNATIKGGKTAKNGGAISVDKGTLSLENVTVTGGEAALNGNGIYIGSATLKVAGKVNVEKQIYLNKGSYITLDTDNPLAEGSYLGVEVANEEGIITTNNVGNAVDYFVSQRKDTPIKVIDGVIAYDLEAADADKHKHSVYGNSSSAAAHGISSTRFIYTAVSTEEELTDAIKNAKANEPIYIYLEKDITLTEATKGANNSSFYINLQSVTATSNNYNGWGDGADKKINLCLNGHTITSHNNSTNDSIRILQLNAKCEFTVCDCGETKGGLVCSTENTANGTGGIANIARSATLNLYGVKLINGTAKQSGAINVATGTLNAYDCEFTGGSSLNTSGLIHLTNSNSTANIYDCSITGATAGYGIYLSENAKSPVLSGKIIVKDNAAGNIYIPSGKSVTLKELDEASVIGFTATEDQVFATTDKDYLEICDLHSDNDGEKITYSDGNYVIGSAEGGHRHAVYGNSASAKNHGIDSTKHLYIPVTTEKELTDAIKNATANTPIYIYLEKDITLTSATKGSNSKIFFINLQSGSSSNNFNGWGDGTNKIINLCLNGHTLTSHNNNTSDSVRILQLNAKCVFNVCDCGETKGGLVYGVEDPTKGTGGIANIARNAVLNLYGVKLINGSAPTAGAINIIAGTLNAYDCEFTGGTTNTGLIHLTKDTSIANIYDCSITGATAGYGIYLGDGAKDLLLSGKIIIKDNAKGNIYIPAGGKVTFDSLTDGSEIGITYPNTGETFATSNDDFSETCNIFSDTANMKPVYESGNYSMASLLTTISSPSIGKTATSSKLAVLSPVFNLLRKAGIK